MKKLLNLSFVVILVLGLLLTNAPKNTVAADSGSHPLVAEGAWSTGTEVSINLEVNPAPTWLQLLSKGVKITESAQICHPLQGGQYGWVGEIRRLVKGKWVMLETTNGWVPSTEGEYMSCAQAPAAGTYALFGYWVRPEGYVEESTTANLVLCPDTSEWWAFSAIVPPDPWHFFISTPNLPGGLPITMELLDPIDPNYVGPKTGSGTTSVNTEATPPQVWTVFWDAPYSLIDHDKYFHSKVRFTFPSLNCYWDVDY